MRLLLSTLCVEGRFWCYMYAAHIQSTWLSAACSVWYTQEKEPFLCSTPTRQISPNINNWSPSGGAAESGAPAAAAGGHNHICGKISDHSRVTSRSNAFSHWMLEDNHDPDWTETMVRDQGSRPSVTLSLNDLWARVAKLGLNQLCPNTEASQLQRDEDPSTGDTAELARTILLNCSFLPAAAGWQPAGRFSRNQTGHSLICPIHAYIHVCTFINTHRRLSCSPVLSHFCYLFSSDRDLFLHSFYSPPLTELEEQPVAPLCMVSSLNLTPSPLVYSLVLLCQSSCNSTLTTVTLDRSLQDSAVQISSHIPDNLVFACALPSEQLSHKDKKCLDLLSTEMDSRSRTNLQRCS